MALSEGMERLLGGMRIPQSAIEDNLITIDEIEAAGFVRDELNDYWERPSPDFSAITRGMSGAA